MPKENAGVVSLAERANDGRMWSVSDMLREALKDMQGADFPKAILICLNDRGGAYETVFYQAGMVKSQIISLLEVAKNGFVLSLLDVAEEVED